MSAQAKTPADESLRIGILVSLLGHVSLVSFFMVKSMIFTRDESANLSALRVDIVALPDKNPPAPTEEPAAKTPSESPPQPVAKAAPPPKPPPPAPPTKKDPETINLDKVKSKEKQALENLKRLQALDKIKEDVAKDEQHQRAEAASAAMKARMASAQVKGNRLSPGTDLRGLDQLQHEQYRSTLDRHIKPYWQLPEWLAHKRLHAQALIRIDAHGAVIAKQLVKPSGNRDFDESVLETIDRATPLPAPPEKSVSMVASDGIFIDFGGDDAN